MDEHEARLEAHAERIQKRLGIQDKAAIVAQRKANLDRRCRHCKRFVGCRVGRGLCNKCWRDPEIKALYPIVAPFGGFQASQLQPAIVARKAAT